MNKRIRELALQAMTATTNKFSAGREWSADEWRDFYDTKFAELIVNECSKVNNQFIGRRIGEIDLDLVYKDHFGVKE